MADDLAAWLTQIWDEQEKAVGETAWSRVEATADGVRVFWKSESEHEMTYSSWSSLLAAKQYFVLARIAADRQILARYVELVEWRDSLEPAAAGGARIAVEHVETIVCLLASAYADRPGYREEWAVSR